MYNKHCVNTFTNACKLPAFVDDVVQPPGNISICSTVGCFESNLATSSKHLQQLQESYSVMVAGGRNESRAIVSEVRFYSALSFSKTVHNVLLDQRVRMNVDSLPNVSEFNSIVSAGMALTMNNNSNNFISDLLEV